VTETKAQDAQAQREADAIKAVTAALGASDLQGAAALSRSALDSGLLHPLFLNLRAYWLETQGRDREALSDLEQARALAPRDLAVLNALGLSLSRQDRLQEAADAFDDAIAVQPDFAPAHFNKGCASEALGELDAARAAYVRATELTPDVAEPFARLASLATRRGDWKDARALAGRALQLDPANVTARCALAAADIEEKAFDAADAALAKLLAEPLSFQDRYNVQGLLGDLRNAQTRYSQAFRAYTEGNLEFREAHAPRFAGRQTALDSIRWLTAHFEAAPTTPRQPADLDPAQHGKAAGHVFLLGFPRSGTTLLEQVLASHARVISMEEKEAFLDSGRVFLGDPAAFEKLASLSGRELSGYRQAYWRRVEGYGIDVGSKVFIDKLPFHTLKLPLIVKLFPDAKILFALRDPRDVLLSCLRRRFRMNPYMYELMTPQDAARFYDAYMNLAELYRRKLPLDLIDLRHEDLVDDFEKETRRVCAFLGIEWSQAMRNFSERGKVRAIATPSAAQLSRGLYREGLGQWRNYEDELRPTFATLQRWVERFGYEKA